MKRIIDGVTYNTDTATLVAQSVIENEGVTNDCDLYQNRAGVYFGVDKVTAPYRDKRGEWQERITYDWTAVGDAAAARKYAEQYGMTILRDIEDMPPEATAGEKMATVYLRVTPTLKTELDEAAAEDKVSGNLWATKCLERCLNNRQGYDLEELVKIGLIASAFTDEEQDRDLCMEALHRIADLVEPLARKITGIDDAWTAIMGLGDSLEIEQTRREFEVSNRR
jgi:hypothetical protein